MAKYATGELRFEILKRDEFTCQYCGKKAPEVKLQVDHITPLSKGGKTDKDNLITSCSECNKGKGNIGLDETREQEENLYVIKPDYFAKERGTKLDLNAFWGDSVVNASQNVVDSNYVKLHSEWFEYPEMFLKEAFNFIPWECPGEDDQLDILYSVKEHNRVSVTSGNGIGKTALAARIAWWWLYTHYPSIVITTAPTNRQVEKQLWGEMRGSFKNANIPLGGELLSTELRLEEGWYALGFSTDEKEKFQGFHSPNILVIVDEASGMSAGIMEAIEGLLTSEGAKLLLIGNPTDPQSYFGRTHLDPRESSLWKRLQLSCWNTPNVRSGKNLMPALVGPGWPAERKRVWGETNPFYLVRVLGEFPPEGEKNLVPYHMVHSALMRSIAPVGEKVFGVDVARFGGDQSIIGRLWGNNFRIVKKYSKMDGPALAKKVVEALRKEEESQPVASVKVDVIGWGASCFDDLKRRKREGTKEEKETLKDVKLVAVNVAEKPKSKKAQKDYLNLRAELGFSVREMFEEEMIDIDDEDLGAQAAGIYYDYSKSNGKFKLEEKEEFKKRTKLRSPDEFDSLMIARAIGHRIPRLY